MIVASFDTPTSPPLFALYLSTRAFEGAFSVLHFVFRFDGRDGQNRPPCRSLMAEATSNWSKHNEEFEEVPFFLIKPPAFAFAFGRRGAFGTRRTPSAKDKRPPLPFGLGRDNLSRAFPAPPLLFGWLLPGRRTRRLKGTAASASVRLSDAVQTGVRALPPPFHPPPLTSFNFFMKSKDGQAYNDQAAVDARPDPFEHP